MVPRADEQGAVIRATRGGPGQFEARLARAEHLLAESASAREPLTVVVSVLRHQRGRAATPQVIEMAGRLTAPALARRAADQFPVLDLDVSVPVVAAEVAGAVDGIDPHLLPTALRSTGEELRSMPLSDREDVVADWLDDPALVEPRVSFWLRVASGAPLELAAAHIEPPAAEAWHGSSCPLCGSPPQVSVIAEESGEFMGGSPRSLVCARCAAWWSFPRITCPLCGEGDSRRVTPFVRSDDRVVRVDSCETCHGYVKTFDLREVGAREVVPLVDDVATMSLDIWAAERGFDRRTVSFAGI
jgi:hypothetical protein